LKVVLQSRIFAGGGTSAHDDRLPELRPLPEAAISPADAAELGVKTCDYVDLQADGKTMHDLLVEVRAGLPQGVVALIDGLPDDPANIFGEGALVRVSNIRKAEAQPAEALR
jgi:anaerobic selenocysteine-containing dehydrogenase